MKDVGFRKSRSIQFKDKSAITGSPNKDNEMTIGGR
jgi:hypothetical protein